MKDWNAKIWLAALALLPPGVVGVDTAWSAPYPSDKVSLDATNVRADGLRIDDASPAVGSLTLQWTLSGRREPIDCGGLGVERFVLTLNSAPGDADEWEGPCDAFEISIDLPPGSYAGDAVLVDRFDRPVTLAVPVESIEIIAGRNLVENIDFPVGSFL